MGSKVQFKKRSRTDYIVVHAADTYERMDIGVREIRQWHKANGWLDVGYHFIIRRDGTVEEGRAHDQIGSHVRGKNSTSVGICLVGGKGDDNKPVNNFTDAQFAALEIVLTRMQNEYTQAKIVGHKDLDSGKACPCFDVASWLYEIKFVI